LGDSGPHAGRAPGRAVETGGVDHLDHRATACARPSAQRGAAAVELDLRGGVRAVAQLVLEALQPESVEFAVGEAPRHPEAGDTAVGLGEDEERVALGSGEEPLVARDLVLRAGAASIDRPADRRVGAYV